jgi:hypothetical protein
MEPKVRVEQVTIRPGARPDHWRAEWRVENLGDAPLKILAARLPHGKFYCEEKELAPGIVLEPTQSGRIELEARCGEPPGAMVENAFLIMRVLWAGRPWLILARLRVCVNEEGTPTATTELITTQPVGFSAKSREL